MSCLTSGITDCLTPSGWGDCTTSLFRVHVGDFETPPTWSDERSLDILKAAAFSVQSDLQYCTSLSVPQIDYCTGNFNTNPYLNPPFINLWVLKAACIVDRGLVRTRALQDGIKATCGPATLQITNGSAVYQTLFSDGACSAYDRLIEDLCFRAPLQTAAFCTQIVGVFTTHYLRGRAPLNPPGDGRGGCYGC